METSSERENYIQLTAAELIEAVKNDPKEAKLKYNNKLAVVKGDITKSYVANGSDMVKLNKRIFCSIKPLDGLKNIFKDALCART